ncbi:hypothetical protein BDV38DRAFT_289065 [Aspergillus pseudotamarii]|uniref:Uncharacterized protein n=1 Tax=Aspergillus pseudotamarii TaxID=132259 RepID=A0A5N6SD60_ASPPS|nr:uncharacterized protein BDV38DRAFT_289065 [Aspergillus pseudotamarii]KAE8131044.1 hypothetical protein BDV38DRAFT_289065 [Aspergillus pseudotamarii]
MAETAHAIRRRPVPEPFYVAMPQSHYGNPGETAVAQMNAANINAGIRANHQFATQRAGGTGYGTIIQWDMYNERENPPYSIALHELGLSRQKFDVICHKLRFTYDNGRKDINWIATIIFGIGLLPCALCMLPCGMFPIRDEHKVAQPMAILISRINRELQADAVPIELAFKVHMQLRPVLHEVTFHHSPL